MATSALPWEWILEHLVDLKDIGTPLLKEIMTYIADVEKKSGLEKRIALRYLEEILASGKIDAQAIPLVGALTKDSTKKEGQNSVALATSSINRDLLLRVQTEAILACIREEPRNWQGFGQALDYCFPEESDDARIVERRKELQTLRQNPNRDKRCLKILTTFSVDALRDDLFKYVALEKCHVQHTFLSQLLRDVLKGRYPLPEKVLMKSFQEYSKTDPRVGDVQTNSVGSDSPTVFCNRSLEDVDCGSVKKSRRASYKLEQGFGMELRERDHDGKAVRSQSSKSMRKRNVKSPIIDMHNSGIEPAAMDVENNSVAEDFLNLGSDGNEEFCHKCRKGGKLLCCDGCPIAVHKGCLGSHSVTGIEEQEWFCPICVQKRAAEAVARAQEKERDAREKLTGFLEGLDNRISKERLSRSSIRLSVQPEKPSMKSHTADCDVFAVETDSKTEAPSEIHMSEAKEASQEVGSKSNNGNERDKVHYTKNKDNADEVLLVPSVACGLTSNANTGELSSKQKKPVDSDQGQVQEEDGDGHDGDLEEGSEDKAASDLNKGQQNSKRKRDVKFRRNNTWMGKGSSHSMRRVRQLWSKDEEVALKEGVQKYSHDNGSWGFQWNRILEFGRGKFHPTRTAVDLKDKWRNLAKSHR